MLFPFGPDKALTPVMCAHVANNFFVHVCCSHCAVGLCTKCCVDQQHTMLTNANTLANSKTIAWNWILISFCAYCVRCWMSCEYEMWLWLCVSVCGENKQMQNKAVFLNEFIPARWVVCWYTEWYGVNLVYFGEFKELRLNIHTFNPVIESMIRLIFGYEWNNLDFEVMSTLNRNTHTHITDAHTHPNTSFNASLSHPHIFVRILYLYEKKKMIRITIERLLLLLNIIKSILFINGMLKMCVCVYYNFGNFSYM